MVSPVVDGARMVLGLQSFIQGASQVMLTGASLHTALFGKSLHHMTNVTFPFLLFMCTIRGIFSKARNYLLE